MLLAERLCQLYAGVARPVLFVGPVGAGKTTLARRLHLLSRVPGELVAISAGELTETLHQDTLFGHVAGAFTGAARASTGAWARAEGGSLLLDDLALMSLSVQAAILRVLEDGRYRPLGAAQDRAATCRVMFATTVPLHDLEEDRRLLPDLRSRIGELLIPVPALRGRREEICTLALNIARRFLVEMGFSGDVSLTPDAEACLLRNPWPRNLRELRGVVERAVIHSGLSDRGVVIRAGHLPDRFHKEYGDPAEGPDLSRSLVTSVLEQVGGNQSEAARRLGVHRNTIARYIKPAS